MSATLHPSDHSPGPTSTLAQGDLAIAFDRTGDRFRQRLLIVGVPCCESVEGDDQQDWPASPALQELEFHSVSGGEVALLVGMAGDSHWSLAVGRDQGQNLTLAFDVACRLKRPPAFLGSAYRLLAGTGRWLNDRLYECPIAGGTLIIGCDANCRVHCPAPAEPGMGQLAITPVESAGKYPATLRWRYTIGFRPDAEPVAG